METQPSLQRPGDYPYGDTPKDELARGIALTVFVAGTALLVVGCHFSAISPWISVAGLGVTFSGLGGVGYVNFKVNVRETPRTKVTKQAIKQSAPAPETPPKPQRDPLLELHGDALRAAIEKLYPADILKKRAAIEAYLPQTTLTPEQGAILAESNLKITPALIAKAIALPKRKISPSFGVPIDVKKITPKKTRQSCRLSAGPIISRSFPGHQAIFA